MVILNKRQVLDDPSAFQSIRRFWHQIKYGIEKYFAPDCAAYLRAHVVELGQQKVRAVWGYPATVSFQEACFALPLIDGYDWLWNSQDAEQLKKFKNKILRDFQVYSFNKDLERANNSTYSTLYKGIMYKDFFSSYLFCNIPLEVIRIVSQLRISSDKMCTLSSRKIVCKVELSENCKLCKKKEESLKHIFFECPYYKLLRDRYLARCSDASLDKVLLFDNVAQIYNTYNFVIKAMKLRAFLTLYYFVTFLLLFTSLFIVNTKMMPKTKTKLTKQYQHQMSTSGEARKSLETFRNFMMKTEVDDEVFSALVILENALDQRRQATLKQKTILHFFN
uniref:Zf-RVT domain-containing protein n=1 Tax=Rhodnius prolixus TaxID=13249 RepID=T1I3K9_RHOPR